MRTITVGCREVRDQLGFLIDEANRGVEVILTRYGRPIAKITAVEQGQRADQKQEPVTA